MEQRLQINVTGMNAPSSPFPSGPSLFLAAHYKVLEPEILSALPRQNLGKLPSYCASTLS